MLRVLILVLALAAGGVAAWLTLGMQDQTVPKASIAASEPKVERQQILVAAVDLKQGHSLSRADMRWQPWPDGSMNPGFLTRSARADAPETLADSVVRESMVAGEPMREEKLARAGSGFLSAVLPPGKRAVAVRVSAETTAGGFIRPNDRVDVIASNRSGEGNASHTILTNIKVLAIDQNADESQSDGATVGKTATLQLDPAQAEAVASAETVGALALALRSSADTDEAPSMAKKTSSATVRILRAGRSETVTIQ